MKERRHDMFELIVLGAAVVAYVQVRRFVRERLRFVDGIQRRGLPFAAGVATTLAMFPVVWLLPGVGGGMAILIGGAIGLGVSRGARDVRASLSLPLRQG
jgi:hypothetical protein